MLSLAGTSLAAKFLRENGITMAKVREETINLLGKSYKYCEVEEQPPLTPQAQKALDWAVDEKLKSGKFSSTGCEIFFANIAVSVCLDYG